MASGIADYVQIIRPRFGGAKHVHDEVTVDANVETDLVTVTGKGTIYGGAILFDYNSTQEQGVPRLYVDEVLIADIPFGKLLKYGLVQENSYPVYLCVQDEVKFIYCAALSMGITFENSFKIAYREFDGTTPAVQFYIAYALL